jgi:hypothetical protein
MHKTGLHFRYKIHKESYEAIKTESNKKEAINKPKRIK